MSGDDNSCLPIVGREKPIKFRSVRPAKKIPVEKTGPNPLDANNVYVARINSADPTGIELVSENNGVAEVLNDFATVNTVQKTSLTVTNYCWPIIEGRPSTVGMMD